MYGAEIIEITERASEVNESWICILLILGVIGIFIGLLLICDNNLVGLLPAIMGVICLITSFYICEEGETEPIYRIFINDETDLKGLCNHYEILETDGNIWEVKSKLKNNESSLDCTYIENNGTILFIKDGKVIEEFKIEEED